MVLYFSATGNTRFVAKEVARGLEDDCIDLLPLIKKGGGQALRSEKPFVICATVYVCEMPRFLASFLKKQELLGSRKVYFIFTSGGYAGISGTLAKSIIRHKNMEYMGHAEFKMPRNYIINDSYPLLEEDEILNRIRDSKSKIPQVVEEIKSGEKLRSRYVFLFEKAVTLPFNPIWVKYRQPAEKFYATDKCIGCGACVKLCPVNNIELNEGKPAWAGPCAHCMACIGNCPAEAIEYGEVTKTRYRYNFIKFGEKAEV